MGSSGACRRGSTIAGEGANVGGRAGKCGASLVYFPDAGCFSFVVSILFVLLVPAGMARPTRQMLPGAVKVHIP